MIVNDRHWRYVALCTTHFSTCEDLDGHAKKCDSFSVTYNVSIFIILKITSIKYITSIVYIL